MVPLVSTSQPLASVQQKSKEKPRKKDLDNPEGDHVCVSHVTEVAKWEEN